MNNIITNEDLFDEFLNFCKNSSKTDVLKHYGGSSIYIPSYSGKARNEDIVKDYKENIKKYSKNKTIRLLSRRYFLSINSINRILKEYYESK